MNPEHLAKLDRCVRNGLVRILPPKTVAGLYSRGRLGFLDKFIDSQISPVELPKQLSRVLWGIEFRSPLFNAAGMFKNGDGYPLVAAQGAGAFLAGTTTANPRKGNEKDGVKLAFSPYPRSRSASNWLGLPNNGDEAVAEKLSSLRRVPGCPIGASVMGSPDLQGSEKLQGLVNGLALYEKAGVDFLELNESCPNTAHGKPQDDDLKLRLQYIHDHFLARRNEAKKIPVIVKFSNDTSLEQVPDLLKLLLELRFDGINFGNTSVNYAKHRENIHPHERRLYDYFTSTFGGGVSGLAVRNDSLSLVARSHQVLRSLSPTHEFHIIRTGGVETAEDVLASLQAGASLVEWYTGYFEEFSRHGHLLYKRLLDRFLSLPEAAALLSRS